MRKKSRSYKKAISEFDEVYDDRKKYLDAGIGDEFAEWQADVNRVRKEQNKLDVMSDEYEAKGRLIVAQLKLIKDTKKAYDDQVNHYDGLLDHRNQKIVLPDINQNFKHEPNWEGYHGRRRFLIQGDQVHELFHPAVAMVLHRP